MKKSEVFRKIVALTKEGNDFLDSVPNSISSVFFDNGYNNAQGLINDLLIDEYFGEHAGSVNWFLYDWKPGYEVEYNGQTTKIDDLDQYIEWMGRTEFFQ